MTIETDYGVVGLNSPIRQYTPESGSSGGLFAGILESRMTAGQGAGATLGKGREENEYAEDIAEIKEKGFVAWYKDLQKEKMEELRQEILGEMGLTEEDLAAMPPEQRADVEKQISEEIQKRMAAMAELNRNEDDEKDNDPRALLERIMPGLTSGVVFTNDADEEATFSPTEVGKG